MKKILLLILLANICCIDLYSQSENIFKTVEYAIGEHSDDEIVSQSLTYTLENGGLHIKGYMMTNCGYELSDCGWKHIPFTRRNGFFV